MHRVLALILAAVLGVGGYETVNVAKSAVDDIRETRSLIAS